MKWVTNFVSKSFSKLAPNVSVSNEVISQILTSAAVGNDCLEDAAQQLGNNPNADIIFKRIKDSDLEKMKNGFLSTLDPIIDSVKTRLNKRSYTVAMDTHSIPYYGMLGGLWIHGYRPDKGCTGSFSFITVSIVVGEAKFVLHALPVRCGEYIEDLVDEILSWVKKRIRIKLSLFDRGFYSAGMIHTLQKLNIHYIIFAPQNKKNKKFLAETPEFSHKYFSHTLEYKHNKTQEDIKVKIVILKDCVDFKSLRIYDWIFASNLSKIEALTYVKFYKQRWAIETSYRVIEKFRIITTSKNIVVRYFLFLTIILLYNLWKFYNLIAEKAITFSTFIHSIFLTQLDIRHIEFSKQLLSPLRDEEEKLQKNG